MEHLKWVFLGLLHLALVYARVRLVEMSHPYNNATAVPPGDAFWKYELINVHKGEWKGHNNVWFELNNFRMSEHAGTHVDSPTHFSKVGWDPSEIPLERLYRVPAVVIDIRHRARQDPHAQLLPEDLENWEARYHRIPDNSVILMNSGWSLKYGTPAYNGIVRDADGNITDFLFPSVSPAAAQWIVDNRPNVAGVGVDSSSVEYKPSIDYPTHRILLGNSIYTIENVKDPHRLPPTGALITVLPIRLEDGSGAAARIVGEICDYSRRRKAPTNWKN